MQYVAATKVEGHTYFVRVEADSLAEAQEVCDANNWQLQGELLFEAPTNAEA